MEWVYIYVIWLSELDWNRFVWTRRISLGLFICWFDFDIGTFSIIISYGTFYCSLSIPCKKSLALTISLKSLKSLLDWYVGRSLIIFFLRCNLFCLVTSFCLGQTPFITLLIAEEDSFPTFSIMEHNWYCINWNLSNISTSTWWWVNLILTAGRA